MPISIAGSGAVTGASTLNGLTVPSDAIAPGIVLITSVSVSATTVSINNCFSSIYENYRIFWSGTSTSGTAGDIRIRWRSAASDISLSNYFGPLFQVNNSATTQAAWDGSFDYGRFAQDGDNGSMSVIDVASPFNSSRKTIWVGSLWGTGSTTAIQRTISGLYNATTSIDGFTVYSSGGSTMNGTIRIYGYRN